MSLDRLAPAALAALVLAAAGCRTAAPGASASTSFAPDSALIRRDVAYLASDALEGRGTGTPGNDSAAAYIARRYASLGLQPLAPGYLQRFTARSAAAAHAGLPFELATQNVVAVIPGTDPALRRQYVVLGAHFDHLGRGGPGALDPEAEGQIHNGADDNASGTAAVMELARIFRRRPARRSIVLANFSGEELGLLGSSWFVEHPPVSLDSVQAMLNFDMVGRLRNGRLLVFGVATAAELPAIVDSANGAGGPGSTAPLTIAATGDGFGPSDHGSFYGKGLPVLHFFTDIHEDYHKATDDADRVNAGGEARVVALAERVARSLADRAGKLEVKRQAAPVAAMGSREGSDVYFGSVPDMGAGDVKGLRLSGVRPGSPADSAGLREGDVVVEFGGVPVGDLYAYTDALYKHKPGDRVAVVVMRGGQRLTMTATLGRRGG